MKTIHTLLAIGMLGTMLMTMPTTSNAANPIMMAVDEVNDDALEVTIAEFNAAEVSTTVWYKLTGIVRNLNDGDQYGNFDLEDETGSVYVYGLLSEKGGAKKQFQQLAATYGITNGSKITIIGNRAVYKEKIEVSNAYFVGVVSDVLEVTYNNSSSTINYGYYTGTLGDGSVLGFYLSGSAYFCGAISSATSIVVPEKVSYNGTEYPVLYFGYDSGYNIDFDEAPNINSLTLPSVLTYIYGNVPASVSELHLLGTTPPGLYRSGCISSSTMVYVPESAYGTYQSYCNNGSNGWSTSIYLKEEGWEPQSYTVTVNTEGTLANQLLAAVEQWTDVGELTIIGHLNAEDMKIFSRLTNLQKLDLSQTDITYISGCSDLKYLETVLLPSTVETVGSEAFKDCKRLGSISLLNATSIGDYAFSGCTKLTTISLPNATSIGSNAFNGCPFDTISLPKVKEIGGAAFSDCGNLQSINAPVLETIRYSAFSGCSLSNIDLSTVKSIGGGAFQGCPFTEMDLSHVTNLNTYELFSGCTSLTKVTLPDGIKEIGKGCFAQTVNLKELNIPSSVETIREGAFAGCGLSEIILPEGVKTIESYAFGGGINNYYSSSYDRYTDELDFLTSISIPSSAENIPYNAFVNCHKLKDLYCYIIAPPSERFINETYATGMTLHVPAFSIVAYKLDDNWYKFGSIVAMDGTIDKLNINSNFTIVDYTGLADKVDLVMTKKAHLTVSAGSTFNLGTFTQAHSTSADGGDYYYDDWGSRVYYGGWSSLISNNAMNADNVNLHLQVWTNRWNFISFPFDVNVSDIEYPEGTLWVIRKYSGADRAALTGNTWQNMSNGTVLQAGEGYILHCANESTSMVEFVFHAVNNAKKNGLFAYQDVVKPLATYASEHAHNRSWNLVGNPYPAYFDTRCIEHNGVITVYNGNDSYREGSYTAYSLLDDDYILHPNEAFFVQCPTDATSMTFKAEGRIHDDGTIVNGATRAPRKAASANSNRKVYNFTMSGSDFSDRTRLVINPDAKMDYEISCDASKFMSDNMAVPQLYVLDNGIRYAIDERPLGDGIIALGARFGQMGEYTISLKNNPAEDMGILLIDNEIGREVNIAEESYTFTAQAGTSDSRFTLVIGSDATGVNEIVNSESSNSKSLYDLQGRRTNSQSQKGIYIIKQNGKSCKVIK